MLRLLGLQRAMVVHGSGLDEITTTGETMVSELGRGKISSYTLRCETYGVSPAKIADLAGGDPGHNARIIRDIFDGEKGATRDIVLMNAGAAIYVGGQARDLHEGISLAASSIDSGSALSRLNSLIEATRSAA